MATLRLFDLALNQALDRQALCALRGGGAPWVFGWATPYTAPATGAAPMVQNFFQSNTYIGQLVDQSQHITINHTGDASQLTAVLIGSPGNAG